MHPVRAFLADESGATAIEYALIASLVALALLAAVQQLGLSLHGHFDTMSDTVEGAGG